MSDSIVLDAVVVDESDPIYLLGFDAVCDAIEREIRDLQNEFYNDPRALELQELYGDMLVRRIRGEDFLYPGDLDEVR